jgi:DNA-binding CsgD family transcriptional regulator
VTSMRDGSPVHGDGGGRLVEREPGALSVTVVGTDPFQLRRLVRLLSGTPGIEVAGWTQTDDPDAEFGWGAVVALVPDDGGPAAAAVPRALPVKLSPRQVEVLVAYGAGSDLLDVVARRLGMYPETLKTHLRRIRQKYREAGRPSPTRRDLYVRAVEDGLLPPPG